MVSGAARAYCMGASGGLLIKLRVEDESVSEPAGTGVGYGEVGRIFSAGLLPHFRSVSAWDIKFHDAAGAATTGGVLQATSMQALCDASDWVISAVTASNTLSVAQAVAPHLRAGMVFLDLNSRLTRHQAASRCNGAGQRRALCGSRRHDHGATLWRRVPMLLGGPGRRLRRFAGAGHGCQGRVGQHRCGLGHQNVPQRHDQGAGGPGHRELHHGACLRGGSACVPALAETFPSIDWEKQGAYFFSRVAQHGQRRAEEMRESAAPWARPALRRPWPAPLPTNSSGSLTSPHRSLCKRRPQCHLAGLR